MTTIAERKLFMRAETLATEEALDQWIQDFADLQSSGMSGSMRVAVWGLVFNAAHAGADAMKWYLANRKVAAGLLKDALEVTP